MRKLDSTEWFVVTVGVLLLAVTLWVLPGSMDKQFEYQDQQIEEHINE